MRRVLVAMSVGLGCGLLPGADALAQDSEKVSVKLTSDQGPLRWLVEEEGRMYRLCEAPCEVRMPAGSYELYLQTPGAPPTRAGEVALYQDIELAGRYESNRTKRIGGGIWLALGTAAGAVLTGFGIAIAQCDPDDWLCFDTIGKGMAAGGSVVLTVSLVGGLVLVNREEDVRLWKRPRRD